jgi:hypothetical protein
MAYIVDYALTYAQAAAANTICNMPQHTTGDLLLAIVTMNSGSASTGTGGTAGWAAWTNNATVTTNTAGYSWLDATASNNTLSLTTGDDYCCTIISIRDWDGTTPFDVTPNISGSTTASSAPANVSITPANTNTLAIYMMSVAGIATAVHSPPGFQHLVSYDNQGTNDANSAVTQSVCWTVHRPSGVALPVPTWDSSLSGAYARMTFAIRNATSGRIPAYIDDSTPPATKLFGGHSVLNGVSLTGSNTMTGNMTNGKTTSFVAGNSTNGADLGINPFSSGFAKASLVQAATALTGFEVNVGTQDFTNDILVGSVIGGTPKMGAFGIGSVSEGGCVVRIGTAASVWKAYQVAAKDANPSTAQRVVFTIKPGFATTQYGTAGSYTGASATTLIQLLSNQPSFASLVVWSEFYRAKAHIISGGDATFPVNTDGMAVIGSSYRLPVIQKVGSAGLLSFVPIQIGGADAVNFQIDAGSLQFPRRYDASLKEIGYHAPDNSVGISYAGKSGDVIKHTNSIISSATPYYWEINSAATNAATWDFRGLVLVGPTVTLRNVMTFDEITFNKFASVNASSCTLTGCVFTEPPSTDASITADATTSFTNCTFNSTTVAQNNAMVSATTLSSFTTCNFTGSTSTGHAIKVAAAAGTTNVTWNNTLSGYVAGTAGNNVGTTSGTGSEAIYITGTSVATVNITVAAGATIPSIRKQSANVTVNITANQLTFTISGIQSGTELRVYTYTDVNDPTTYTEFAGAEVVGASPSGSTFTSITASGSTFTATKTYNGGTAIPVLIVAHNLNYQFFRQTTTLSASENTPYTLFQVSDRNYDEGATPYVL